MARSTFNGPVRSLNGFISTGNNMAQAIATGTTDASSSVDTYQGKVNTFTNLTSIFNLPEIVTDSGTLSKTSPGTTSTIGYEYSFLCNETLSGNTFTLNAGTAAGRSTADVFQGTASYVDTGDNSMEGFHAAGADTLTLDGSTRGGLGGSIVYCRAAADGIWLIDCALNGSGTMVTPWS